MHIRFTTLIFILFCYNLAWANSDPKQIQLHQNGIVTNLEMPDATTHLEICGLEKGKQYTLALYDERFDPDNHYDWGMKGKIADGYFTTDTKCAELIISKKNKNRGMTYPYLNINCLDCTPSEKSSFAPIQVQDNNDAVSLIKDIFLSSNCFKVIESSIEVKGVIGTFSNGFSSIGMEDGIMLGTGALQVAQGPNSLTGSTSINSPSETDADLGQAASTQIRDAASIEFDFVPTTDEISFEYVFASEEYCDYTTNPANNYTSPFNDAFGFFISGPGIGGNENIALIPGTTTPVSINTVNYNSNSQYYISNVPSNQVQEEIGCSPAEIALAPAAASDIEYDGYTTVLTARRNVTPCETYHLKMVVGDAVDQFFDSAVFLKANSFTAGGKVDIEIAFDQTGENYLYENCGSDYGTISFIRQDVLSAVEFLNISVTAYGTASGSDYTVSFNQTVTIPPLPPPGIWFEEITVLFDDIPEGIEWVRFELDVPCDCDIPYYEILIIDPPPIVITNVDDRILCDPTPVTITPNIDGGLPSVAQESPAPDYIYNWTGPNNFTSSNQQANFTPPSEPGAYEYYLTVADDCGNIAMDTALITVVGAPEASIAGTGFICNTNPTTNLAVSLTGPGPWDVVYSINGVEQPVITATSAPFLLPADQQGMYELISVQSGDCPGEVSGMAMVEEPTFVLIPDPQNPTCAGIADGLINLDVMGGTTPYTYAWSDGQTTANAVDINAGSYAVVITDANGCTEEATASLTEPTPVDAQTSLASGTTCTNPTSGAIDLAVSGGTGTYTYAWSDGSDSQNATGLVAGNYDVTVADENGCTALANLEVPADLNVPMALAAANDELTCTTTTVAIDGGGSSTGGNITYQWTASNGGNIVGDATLINPSVDATGIYQLVVTDNSNGCTSTAEVVVNEDVLDPIPDAQVSGSLSCTETSVTLDASGSSGGSTLSYTWNTGDTNVTTAATDAGTYTLIVTNTENGCTAITTAIVIEDITPPDANAGNPSTLDCTIEQTNLDGSASSSGTEFIYQWTASNGGNIVGDATSISPEIDAAGSYDILVTNTGNGCTNTANVVIDENVMPPLVEAGLTQELSCAVASLTLDGTGTATDNVTYLWETPNGNILSGAGSLAPEINAPGTYNLVVTDNNNGCTAVDMVEITQDLNAPISDAGMPSTLTCLQTDYALNGTNSTTGANIDFTWTTTNGNFASGETTLSPMIDAPGTYVLTLTNTGNNCTAVSSVTIEEDTANPIANAGEPSELNCSIQDAILGGTTTSTGDNFNYQWTSVDGNISSANSSEISLADAPGTYELLVTDTNNGCTAVSVVEITQDITPPVADPGISDDLTCVVTELTLDASASSTGDNIEYLWTTTDGNILIGETTTAPDINQAGLYNLLVTNTNNMCTATQSISIAEQGDFPAIAIAMPAVLDCATTTLSLDGTGSSTGTEFSYSWTTTDGNIISDSDAIAPMIDAPGTYQLVISNSDNGCTSVESIEVLQDIALPIANAGLEQILSCLVEDVTLDGGASSTGDNFSYEWTTVNGNVLSGANTLNPSVDQASDYTLIVTNTDNNCTTSAEVAVLIDANAPVALAGAPSELNCTINEITLDGTQSSQDAGLEYTWTTTNGNILDGADGLTPNVDAAGTYTLSIFDPANGCETSSNVTITQDVALPIVVAGTPEILNCTVTELILDATGTDAGTEFLYLWMSSDGNVVSGGNTLNPTIDEPGTYTLLVTNINNNCTASNQLNISEDTTPPTVAIDAPELLTCTNFSFNLGSTGSSTGGNFDYQWTTTDGNILNGADASSPEIDMPGTYVLQITDTDNNCVSMTTQLVEQDVDLPTIIVAEPSLLTCAFPTSLLSATGSSTGGNFDYEWTTTDGNIQLGATSVNAVADAPGTYNLLITNTENACTNTTQVTIDQDNTPPLASAGTDLIITCDEQIAFSDGSASSSGANFSYEWTTTDGNIVGNPTDINISINQVGEYNLVVTNTDNGCTATDALMVTSNDVIPQASIADPDVLDCDTEQISLIGNASNGTNLTYNWTTTNGNILDGLDTENPTVDAPGIYTLLVQNLENGCATTTEITVTQNITPPTVDAGDGAELNCTTTEVNLNGSGSTGAEYTYTWTSIEGNIVSGANSLTPNVDAAGTYNLLIINTENACTNEDNVAITLNENVPTGILANVTPPPCFGDPGTINIDEITGGQGPFQYSLDGINFSDETVFSNLSDGTDYTVYIIDVNGCELEEFLSIPTVPEVTVDLIPEVEIQFGENAELNTLTNIPLDEIQSITWTPNTDLSCDDCLTPISSTTQTTTYEVTVVNQNGCEDSAEILLRVDREFKVYIPNAFSPFDNNTINDRFTVFAREGVIEKVNALHVYDRWGNKVYEELNFPPNDAINHGWDGYFRDKTMNPAVYVYWVEVLLADGQVEIYKGDVSLIR